jgi:hypothetical protein
MSRRRLLAVTAAVGAASLLLLGGTASSYGPTPTSTWVVSGGSAGGGVVASTAISGSTAYVGGNFSYAGPSTGSFVAADTTTGFLTSPWPQVGGNVYAAAPDGAGGFFIGGRFSSIGPYHADNIAHVNADGTLDTAWTGSTDGVVYALAVSADTVYAGGDFNNAGGAARVSLAGFVKSTGALNTSFASSAEGTGFDPFVASLRLSGSSLYVGGRFTTLGGSARTNFGAVSATSGGATGFSANTDGIVFAIAVGPTGTVYAGGAFTHVKTNDVRNFAAAFDSSGTLLPWDPDPNGEVYALEVSGSSVYAGGAFEFIGAFPRNALARVSATGEGDAEAWDPDVIGQVYALAVPSPGTTVYAGGEFQQVDVLTRDNVAAFNASDASATSFAPVIGGEVDALAISGSTIGLGGEFRSAGDGASSPAPQRRSNLAAFDLTTGEASSWNPGANGTVEVVLVSGSVIYAGGSFTVANGQTRERLAAFTTGGAATPWNPGVHNGSVLALTIVGDTVYAGGTFSGQTSVSNPPVAKNRLAAFQANGVGNGLGNLVAQWDPNANGSVFALDAIGSTIYVGGSFTTFRNNNNPPLTVKNRLAALPATGVGEPLPWDPNANGPVFTITHSGSTVYAGGAFTTVRGFPRGGAAAFNPTEPGPPSVGVPTPWNPQVLLNPGVPGEVYSLAASASTMYVSGFFRTVGGFFSPSLVAVSLATGAPNQTWQPVADDIVSWIALGPQGLAVGGRFTALGYPPPGSPYNPVEPAATYRGGFAHLRALPDAPTSVTATAGDTTATVAFQPPAYDGGAPITSYTLTSTPAGITLNDVTSPVSVTGLTNGTAYTFSVTATTSAGTGEPGTSNSVTPVGPPGAPTGVIADAGSRRATISFTAPPDGGSPITQYTVTSSGGQTATGTSSPIDVTGLTNGVEYTFTVKATNAVGTGPDSAPSNPVTPDEGGRPHPPAPEGLGRPPLPTEIPPVTTPRPPPPNHP